MVLAALAASLSAIVPSAASAETRTRCCFLLKARSHAELRERYSSESIKGDQHALVAWEMVGIFRYREQRGFGDLVSAASAHEHTFSFTESSLMDVFNSPPQPPEPVAEPGSCVLLRKKRLTGSPTADLFGTDVSTGVRAQEEAKECMYGVSMLNWGRVRKAETKSYAPWQADFREPPAAFFHNGRGAFNRQTGFDSSYSPLRDYGVIARYAVVAHLSIEWFPESRLQKRIRGLQGYHHSYDFRDLCDDVPAGAC